ncbi:MAG: signal peptidase I [Pseudomonadales bacterium]|nr:signal peptidase I [Pseudomonadales bacterium]
MDIDFPLIMVIGVFVTGVIWAADLVFLAPKRRVALAQTSPSSTEELEQQSAGINEPIAVEYAKSFFPILLIVLVLRSFLFEPFQIPTGSMIPSLKIGDFLLVNKFAYGVRLPVIQTKIIDVGSPERGDVMVFRPPHKPGVDFIKRVIGLPGDRIVYKNRVLYINGEQMQQTFVARLPAVNPDFTIIDEKFGDSVHRIQLSTRRSLLAGEWLVPEGHYFMMGDNRDNSADSRVWGFVPEENIVGKAYLVWMHWKTFWSLPSFSDDRLIK